MSYRGGYTLERFQHKARALPQGEYGAGRSIRATYGFGYIKGNRRPYFSVTGEISTERQRARGDADSCGCIHDEIARWFPALKPLIRWHLVDDDGVGMHYAANALYWLEYVHGISAWKVYDGRGDPLELFRSTVVWGALPGDTEEALAAYLAPLDADTEDDVDTSPVLHAGKRKRLAARVGPLLAARLPGLREAMRADMERFGVEYIKPEEYAPALETVSPRATAGEE